MPASRSGRRAARCKVPLDHVLVLHDEIDLPFGEIRVRLGGGLAGHNGLKSLKQGLGSADFGRVRVGVGPAADAPIPTGSPPTCWAASASPRPTSGR